MFFLQIIHLNVLKKFLVEPINFMKRKIKNFIIALSSDCVPIEESILIYEGKNDDYVIQENVIISP